MSEIEESCFLYMITNKVNGKSYIGVSNNPTRRMREHLHENRPNSNLHLKSSVKKYGADNFEMKILCEGSRDYIFELEAKAIDLYDTLNSGYNQAPGGRGGQGKKIKKRSDDYECFVAGFWFPNKRTACEALNITNTNVFYTRKKLGILGDVETVRTAHVMHNPTYFKGFWFESVNQASEIFNKPPETIRKYILLGKFEENSKLRNKPPKRKPVINGTTYNDLREASLVTSVPYNTLRQYFYQNKEGYSYEYTTT